MNKKKIISSALALYLCLINFVSAADSIYDIKIEIDGKNIVADVAPFIDNNRTLVPIRVISENLGYNVDWDNQTREVTVKNNDRIIELAIGKKEVHINGINSTIDVAPVIKNDRTFVPLRFISESFDNDVSWSNNTKTVKINKKENKSESIFSENENINKDYSNVTKPSVSQITYSVEPIAIPLSKTINEELQIKTNILDKEQNTTPTKPNTLVTNKQEEENRLVSQSAIKEKNILNLRRTQNKYKDLSLDNIRSVYITIGNDTWMNFDLYKEKSDYNQLKQEYESATFGETPQEKIRQLDMSYNLDAKQYRIQYCIEYYKTASELYQNLYDTFMKMWKCIDENEIKDFAKQCENQTKAFNVWRNDKVINGRLFDYLKEREYIAKKIDLLNLIGSENNKESIFKLNQKLIQTDSFIMYTRNSDTDFTMYPQIKKLLEEYDNDIRRDVENYHISK